MWVEAGGDLRGLLCQRPHGRDPESPAVASTVSTFVLSQDRGASGTRGLPKGTGRPGVVPSPTEAWRGAPRQGF